MNINVVYCGILKFNKKVNEKTFFNMKCSKVYYTNKMTSVIICGTFFSEL